MCFARSWAVCEERHAFGPNAGLDLTMVVTLSPVKWLGYEEVKYMRNGSKGSCHSLVVGLVPALVHQIVGYTPTFLGVLRLVRKARVEFKTLNFGRFLIAFLSRFEWMQRAGSLVRQSQHRGHRVVLLWGAGVGKPTREVTPCRQANLLLLCVSR